MGQDTNDLSAKKNYTYFAFISYKSENANDARWLKSRLQSYRLPIRTHRQHVDLPGRCSPVFLDKTNLTPGSLNEELCDEVQSSQYIVVICSRAANATPKYLNAELRFFLEGGGDPSHVIPFIVDESENPEEDCYPSALTALCRSYPIEGIRVWEHGKQKALLCLVARMLGITYGELEHGEARRRRIYRCFAALASIFVLLGLYQTWMYVTPRTGFYLDYTEVYGEPVGIGKITEDEACNVYRHYRIVSQRGKVRELSYENTAGTLAAHTRYEHMDRPSRMTYEYRRDGKLSRVSCYNQFNKMVLVLVYSEINAEYAIVDLTENGQYNRASAVSLGSLPGHGNLYENAGEQGGDMVSRYWLFFDKNGFVSARYYIENAALNTVACDADGISGLKYARNKDGQTVYMELQRYHGEGGIFRADGRFSDFWTGTNDADFLIKNKLIDGVYFEYSNSGDVQYVELRNADQNPAANSDGVAVYINMCDEMHRPEMTAFYDENAELTEGLEGYAYKLFLYNDEHYQIQEICFDTDRNPVLADDGFVMKGYRYNDKGRIVEKHCVGKKIVSFLYDYDDIGNAVRESILDENGQPMLGEDGYAVCTSEYDDRGNLIGQRYFGIDEKPVCAGEGYAAITWSYNEMGQMISRSTFDADGSPKLTAEGYASVQWDYDDMGNTVKESYFGTENEAVVLPKYGYASIEKEYDNERRVILIQYLGLNGEKVCSPYYGYSGREYCYSNYDAKVQASFFLDTEGRRMKLSGGYAGISITVNNNKIESLYYLDENEKPIVSGLYFQKMEYENFSLIGDSVVDREMGEKLEVPVPYYLDDIGYPVTREGCEAYEVCTGSGGRVIRWVWMDKNGNPVEIDGSAGYLARYTNDSIHPSELLPLKKDHIEELEEMSIRRVYDHRGIIRHIQFFDKGGIPISTSKYNDLGAYSSIDWVYNERCELVDVFFSDEMGNKVLCKGEFAQIHLEHDENGHLTSVRCLGTGGEPVYSSFFGWSSLVYNWDERISECTFLDADGEPILFMGEYASFIAQFDENGNITKVSYFGTDGKLLETPNIAVIEMEYNERGDITRERYFGSDGKPMLNGAGVASTEKKYDERGNWTEYCFFDEEGNPCFGNYDCARLVMRYDNRGNIIETMAYDVNGNRIEDFGFNLTDSAA